ncbi:protein phosphatase 2C domain-containing protein [Streptomyces sp. M10(2022)]
MARFLGHRHDDAEEPPESSAPDRTPDGRAPAAPGYGLPPSRSPGRRPVACPASACAGRGPSSGRSALVPAQETREPRLPGAHTPSWARLLFGRPTARFEPKPPASDPYRPDTLFDGWSTPGLTVRLASVRGDAHRFGGQPRQDDIVVAAHEPTDAVVFAVADGVSAAPQSHVGAALACRTAVADVLRQLDEERQVDWKRVVTAAAYQLFMRVSRGAEPTREQMREAQDLLATTLVTGVVRLTAGGQLEVNLVHVGDSGAWMLHEKRFHPLLGSKGRVRTGSSPPPCRRCPGCRSRSRDLVHGPRGRVLLIGTDGFGDPLGDGGEGSVR